MTRVAVAGAAGKMGATVCEAVAEADGLELSGRAGNGNSGHAATRASLTGARAERKRSSSAPTQAAERRSAP